MKEIIDVNAWAARINAALSQGVLLNTNGEKFNAMVIGWGQLGRIWNMPVFTAYVREGRFTRRQLDETRNFTVSIPLEAPDAAINRVCGWQSGRDVDKAAAAHLTPEPPMANATPGVREYPLTLECEVVYSRTQDPALLPGDVRAAMYPPDVDGSCPMSNRDAHVEYIGRIVAAYIIR